MGHKTSLSKLQVVGRGRERERESCPYKMVPREIPILKLFCILNMIIATQTYDSVIELNTYKHMCNSVYINLAKPK